MAADVMEEKVRDALLAFVDFLYAVVFGIIVAQLLDQVLTANESVLEKGGRIFLVIGVFYFLTWDWLHGRLLTLKNPYKGYRRFFLEIIIAFAGYGAARAAILGEITLLYYTGIILVLGAWWARMTISEYPNSDDIQELRFIQWYQLTAFVGQLLVTIIWYRSLGPTLAWWGAMLLNFFGMAFVFVYELRIERVPGILGGPGVPFVSRQVMTRIRRWANHWRQK